MISDLITNDSDPWIYGQKKINPIRKNKVQLERDTLGSYFVKRYRARVLEMDSSSEYSPIKIKLWRRAIKYIKHIEELVFYDDSCLMVPMDFTIEGINTVIKRHPSMERLSINFAEYGQITEEQMDDLKRCLKKLVSLKRMKLDFGNRRGMTEKKIQKLSKSLKAQNHLQSINLNFSSTEINDKGAETLGQNLKRLTYLENIELRFKDCEKITGAGFGKFLQPLKRNRHLKSLDMNFAGKNITDQGMHNIGQNLKDLSSLLQLKLNFSSLENLTNEGFFYFGLGLTKLNSLKSMIFRFELMPNHITHFRFLEQQGLSSLRDLQLSFIECPGLEDSGLKSLEQGLGTLGSLKSLVLNFYECQKVNGAGIQGLKALTSLQTLSLDWKYCYGFGDLGMQSIGEGLKFLCSLKTLRVNIQCSDKITEKGMKDFSEGLKGLCCLKDLYFQIYGGSSIDSEIKCLIESLNDLFLERITLNLSADTFSEALVHDLGKINSLKRVKLQIELFGDEAEADKKVLDQAISAYPCMKESEVETDNYRLAEKR